MTKAIIHILPVCLGLLQTFGANGQTAAADNKRAEIPYYEGKGAREREAAAANRRAAAGGKPAESIALDEVPRGLALDAVFEGRSPCFVPGRPLSSGVPGRQPDPGLPAGCDHLKWRIIFFRDAATLKPATCILVSDLFGYKLQNAKWKIVRGTRADPAAVVYVLNWGQPDKSIYLLKGDENVLFFLDEGPGFRVGNQDFSYTLNRVKLVREER
ncbi:MAG TPA: hypothetical protein VK563_17535 [Puia sp.]|nr:hypothetical protein [Puia sp.]